MASILLIDDDDSFRASLRMALVHFGHQVIEARNGEEGLALFRDAGADLVITDIIMPEKDGMEVLLALHKLQSAVKILAISGGGRFAAAKNYLQTAKALGAAQILAKPFTTDSLQAAINELLSDGC